MSWRRSSAKFWRKRKDIFARGKTFSPTTKHLDDENVGPGQILVSEEDYVEELCWRAVVLFLRSVLEVVPFCIIYACRGGFRLTPYVVFFCEFFRSSNRVVAESKIFAKGNLLCSSSSRSSVRPRNIPSQSQSPQHQKDFPRNYLLNRDPFFGFFHPNHVVRAVLPHRPAFGV